MARINTNVAALVARQGLATSQQSMNVSLQRLSTGLKINSGADDPAGLIASENMRSELAGINQAIDNSTQATNVLATAEGALNEVSTLLTNVKSLIVQSANTGAESDDEIKANQMQLDSAVQTITRISQTTSFAGQKLIDGSLDYVTSGVVNSAITTLDIAQAQVGTAAVPVNVKVTKAAAPAELKFAGSAIASSVTLQIGGTEGTQVLTFTSGTHTSAIAFAINRISDSTGVSAATVSSTGTYHSGVVFKSSGYGSKDFVSISAQKGVFAVKDTTGAVKTRSTGVDAVATINGSVTVGDGLNLKLNTTALDMDLTLGKTFGTGTTQFAITGGGATFQLGPEVQTQQQVSLGIGSVSADKLGNSGVGFLSDIVTGGDASLVGGQETQASTILDAAIDKVSLLRGRLGAFQKNTLQTNVNSLNVAMTDVTSSESDLRDTDFAEETSNLTRAQVLVQAGTSVLSTANSAPNTVLSLLQH